MISDIRHLKTLRRPPPLPVLRRTMATARSPACPAFQRPIKGPTLPDKDNHFRVPLPSSQPLCNPDGGYADGMRVKPKVVDLDALRRKYSMMIQTSTTRRCLVEGRSIHGHIVRSGVDPDAHLWVCLLDMYGKCGGMRAARKAFEEMPRRDVAAWTVMIAGCNMDDDGLEGVFLFSEMHKDGILPNGHALAAGLKACSTCCGLGMGKQAHGMALKLGYLSDFFVGAALVGLYVRCREMELAEKTFFSLPQRNDVSLVALLSGYAQEGCGSGGRILRLFQEITDPDTRLSKNTLSIVLKCCTGLGDARRGQMAHSLVVKTGSDLDCILGSCLVDMYSNCGLVKDALKVFSRIKDPDVVAWSSMISCLKQQGLELEAAKLFIKMGRTGRQPNQFTLASLASAAADIGERTYGCSVHSQVIKLGFENDNAVGNALINMYMKIGDIQDGCMMFGIMTNRDTISWNSLLSGFHCGDYCDNAFEIFNQMHAENFKPNKYTFISILRSCTSLKDANVGVQIHAHIIKNSLDNDQYVGTSLVDMYANCGYLNTACLVFSRLKEKDVFTWTVMITGYSRTDQGEQAIKCFRNMKREGVNPNEFTFASCLRACSSLSALDTGQQIHSQITKLGLSDAFVSSALVDLYGKCGCLRTAEDAFDDSIVRDEVLWNTIICTYSQHGYGKKALMAFQYMTEEGAKPDEITFIGVLSACSHAGLVDEGWNHFNSLRRLYGITPTIEHHACMVDILSRAGNLDEARHFIEKMTITPNILIWQTVLGACKMHGNIEFGEKAAEKLFELDPSSDTTYILLSNLYAAAKMWNEVSKVRSLMSTQGVKKEPGCSWIVIAGQVHVFLPNDVSHPKINEIHVKLKELAIGMELAGYISNTEYVLHDISVLEKQENLLYHSERLALAYGLMKMEQGRTIRIFKNLRICGDCHNAIKIISAVTEREIIVRDISRFHHFQDGSCSCCDFW